MSESTEELTSAVQGVGEVLAGEENFADQLSDQATELAEEAAGHGWHGMATRMQDVAEALQTTKGHLITGRQACEAAFGELGQINDKIPAEEVVAHLTTSTTQLGEALTAVEGAVGKAEEAQMAAEEIGQQGMMQATLDLYGRLTEVHEQIVQQQATSESERAAAAAYENKQLGN